MKLSSLAYTLFPLAALTGCGSSRKTTDAPTVNTSTWQQQPLTVDGQDNDWTKPLPGFSQTEHISYEIANDNDNLYILISCKDPQEQMKMIQGGMTVWINTKADKTQGDAMGIGYPLDSRNDHDQTLMEEAQPDRYKHKPSALQDKKDYALYGFGKESEVGNYAYGDENPQGIKMRMDYNNAGELIYEAAIPLAVLYPGHSATASYAAKSIALGIFVDGLPPDSNVPRGGGNSPSVGVGGGLGFGSFGSGGGLGLSIGVPIGGGGGGGGRNRLFKNSEIWQVVQLSSVKRGF